MSVAVKLFGRIGIIFKISSRHTNMYKSVNVGLLLTILGVLHVSLKGIEGVNPYGLQEEIAALIRTNVLERTNFYRGKHGIGQLELNQQITEAAQLRANQMAKHNTFEHDETEQNLYGENMAKTKILPNIGEAIVDLWYSVIVRVDVCSDANTLYENTGIGTMIQLLWKKSTLMGVGVSRNLSETYWVVAYYDPSGIVESNPYFVDLPNFTPELVNRENVALLSEDLTTTKSISISNRRTGLVVFPIFNGGCLRSPTSPTPKNIEKVSISKSSVRATGFDEQEAIRIRERILKKINFYRIKHELATLILDAQLNDYAQDWANYMASSGTKESSPLKGLLFGENVNTSDVIVWGDFGEIAVDLWYSEIMNACVHMTESIFEGDYHMENLTQLLWKSTTMMGVGVAVDALGQYHVVVDFRPRGNISTQFVANLTQFKQEDINAGAVKLGQLKNLLLKKSLTDDIHLFN